MACHILPMSERYKRHVPEPVKTVRSLGTIAARPTPAKPAAKPDARDQPAGNKDRDEKPREIGGPSGSEPTRYGDWEINGRCIDF